MNLDITNEQIDEVLHALFSEDTEKVQGLYDVLGERGQSYMQGYVKGYVAALGHVQQAVADKDVS